MSLTFIARKCASAGPLVLLTNLTEYFRSFTSSTSLIPYSSKTSLIAASLLQDLDVRMVSK